MSNPEQNPEITLPTNKTQPEKRKGKDIIILIITILGVLAILYTWQLPPFKSNIVSTNNVYVRGQTTLISPRVGGYVKEVLVSNFFQVKQGDPLVRIDDAPYLAHVAQAKANLSVQQTQLGKVGHTRTSANANAKTRQTAIHNAQVQLNIAQTNFNQLNSVKNSAGITTREYEQAQTSLEQAAYVAAQTQYTVTQQELDHTTIYAPADGKLGEIAVKKGQLISAGIQLMFIVPPKR